MIHRFPFREGGGVHGAFYYGYLMTYLNFSLSQLDQETVVRDGLSEYDSRFDALFHEGRHIFDLLTTYWGLYLSLWNPYRLLQTFPHIAVLTRSLGRVELPLWRSLEENDVIHHLDLKRAERLLGKQFSNQEAEEVVSKLQELLSDLQQPDMRLVMGCGYSPNGRHLPVDRIVRNRELHKDVTFSDSNGVSHLIGIQPIVEHLGFEWGYEATNALASGNNARVRISKKKRSELGSELCYYWLIPSVVERFGVNLPRDKLLILEHLSLQVDRLQENFERPETILGNFPSTRFVRMLRFLRDNPDVAKQDNGDFTTELSRGLDIATPQEAARNLLSLMERVESDFRDSGFDELLRHKSLHPVNAFRNLTNLVKSLLRELRTNPVAIYDINEWQVLTERTRMIRFPLLQNAGRLVEIRAGTAADEMDESYLYTTLIIRLVDDLLFNETSIRCPLPELNRSSPHRALRCQLETSECCRIDAEMKPYWKDCWFFQLADGQFRLASQKMTFGAGNA